jgi:hypothetical protein
VDPRATASAERRFFFAGSPGRTKHSSGAAMIDIFRQKSEILVPLQILIHLFEVECVTDVPIGCILNR